MSLGITGGPVSEIAPAFEALADDVSIERVAWRVFMRLRRRLDYMDVRVVKVRELGAELGHGKKSVISALNQLVDGGYLREHERGSGNARRFTLVWSLAPKED